MTKAGRALAALVLTASPAAAQQTAELGTRLERFAYPWPVSMIDVAMPDGGSAEMAFMDVTPPRPNGESVVLLHGKNFCGATWEHAARALLDAGYRVLIPDQIGFCKSDKPEAAQYSLSWLADNTARLMAARGIARAHVVGHSMGGMLAMRFAIDRPELVDRLVLVNPLGLADRAAEGVPYKPVAELLAGERRTSAASIRAYQQANYYDGKWEPRFDRWVEMLGGMYAGAGREQVALAQAKTSEMILTQPVAHVLHRIRAPTTLLIGQTDKTVFGKAQAPEKLRAGLRPIPAVASEAAGKIPGARLVPFDDLGHSPQVEAPDRFVSALIAALGR